jgi:hypothetical protein
VHRHLADHVGRGAEPVQPKPLAVAGQAQRPVADQPGAQERRGLQVRIAVGQREAEALVRNRVLGVAAVDVAPGEARALTQVLEPSPAVRTLPARPAQPGHAHPAAAVHARADDLMAEDQRQVPGPDVAVAQVQVGPADAAGVHADQDLPGGGPRLRHVGETQRPPGSIQDHRAHRE